MLDPQPHAALRAENASLAKPAAPSRVPIQIRETANGGITLAGVTEAEVRSKEEMASYLTRGSLSRATGSTNMNSQSRLVMDKRVYNVEFYHLELLSMLISSLA